jgi:hypothetical protein
VAEKIHIIYRAVGSSSATTRISLSDLRYPENAACGVSYRSETAMCLPHDEHFLILVVDAPRGLPIARVRWLTGKADRDYQRAGSNEILPLPPV